MASHLLTVAALLGISLSAVAVNDVPRGPHITVVGHSQLAVKPDQALLKLQITLDTQHTSDAKQKMDRLFNRYLTFLQQQGINQSHIDASRIQSQRIWQAKTDSTESSTYYRFSRQLTVTLQQLTLVEPLLDEALRCGLQEWQPVHFTVTNENLHRQQARKLAIQDAIQQAEQIAQSFSSRRGAVYSIRYNNHEPLVAVRSLRADSDQVQSYLPPAIYFTDQVEATFRLADYPRRKSAAT